MDISEYSRKLGPLEVVASKLNYNLMLISLARLKPYCGLFLNRLPI